MREASLFSMTPLAIAFAFIASCHRRPQELPPGDPPKATTDSSDAAAPAQGIEPRRDASALRITAKAFAQGKIPQQFTCEGGEKTPGLAFESVPTDAKSLVLIVKDVDVPDPAHPAGEWVHWVLYNIPPSTAELPEAMTTAPAGALVGKNDFRRAAYNGPCPSTGRHRFVHKLFALDTLLPDLKNPNAEQLEYAMHGHVLEQADVTGSYQKMKK